MRCKIFLLAVLICCSYRPVQAQLRWIADARFPHAAGSLYDMTAGGKSLILAVGNLHTQMTDQLADQNLLQSLQKDTKQYMPDVRLAFLNVMVFDSEQPAQSWNDLSVLNIREDDTLLSLPGWNNLYSITATGLFLITPDHLVYQLEASTADAIERTIRSLNTRLQPLAEPDVRLLNVRADEPAGVVEVAVQNFSQTPLQPFQIDMIKDGTTIATATTNGIIAPMAGGKVAISLDRDRMDGIIQVVAHAPGDINQTNNSWQGRILLNGMEQTLASGLW